MQSRRIWDSPGSRPSAPWRLSSSNITNGLISDAKVQIQGFGTFQTKHRKARMGINPQTKQPMQIPASKTVGFKPGQDLKSKV